MSKKTRGYKRFDTSVKEKALERLKAGATAKSVAEALGVSYPTIINWKRVAGLTGSSDESQGTSQPDELRLLKLENDYLRKRMETSDEVERLRLEVEYLKKRLAVYEGERTS